jgi:Protein of unknown function (DUF2934)
MRKAVEERAYFVWLEAGCPEGQAARHWSQAEAELGLATPAAAGSAEALRRSVGEAVPSEERLPRAAGENPLSEHVQDVADGRALRPGATTFEGGDEVER